MNLKTINNKYLDTNNYLRHITDKSIDELGGILHPAYNYNMFRDNPDFYVFSTNLESYSKALYFLRSKGFYAYSESNDKTLVLIKTAENYINSFYSKKYMYFLPYDGFEEVLYGHLDHTGEFVSLQNIPVSEENYIDLTFNDVINTNELGVSPEIYVCNNIDNYRSIRREIDSLEYDDKIDYLDSINSDSVLNIKKLKR